ncbi:PREDICTED: serpin-ZX-like [Fragaria vesca subsp. vesca]|uniref:serpin-ZX-like n=1 Tax=Fragaria vesca subsp. vesca TaxID=101020 RepID=UPI0002C2F018|nr:PREDICTED: serpin-ZX-like [Fragaria vesca subsp. vesca]
MDTKDAITSQSNVALELTKQLFLTEFKGQNMVFSPLSLHFSLSLVASGTKGPCLDEFLSFLKSRSTHHLNSLAHDIVTFVLASGSPSRPEIEERYGPGPRLSFANGVWVDKSLPFKPYFKHVVDTAYMAALEEVDFKSNPKQVSIQVNSWAEKETNGLIKDILPADAVDSNTKLIFANALYFKAYWVEKFSKSATRKRNFYLLDGSSVKGVPFMRDGGYQSICAFEGFKVLKLPYRNLGVSPRCFSMYFCLPDARDGLPALVEDFCSGSEFLEGCIPDEELYVGEMLIPKFKISSGFEASKVLKTSGLVLPFIFDPVKGGNVTEMVESPAGEDPYVSAMFHKSCIEIDEEGTEASAVTVTQMCGGGAPPVEIDFVADHPFVFFIREDRTGTVLFMGTVLNPLAG